MDRSEAKAKCIAMWEYIAANITDKKWRRSTDNWSWATAKKRAIQDLFPEDDTGPPYCYLCVADVRCTGGTGPTYCPLDGCMMSGNVYGRFCHATDMRQYKRAAKWALRLAEQVETWDIVGERDDDA